MLVAILGLISPGEAICGMRNALENGCSFGAIFIWAYLTQSSFPAPHHGSLYHISLLFIQPILNYIKIDNYLN